MAEILRETWHDMTWDNMNENETLEGLQKGYHDRLCGILVEGAALALRNVFNGIHPHITLAEELHRHHVKFKLKRLLTLKVCPLLYTVYFLSQKYWINPSISQLCSRYLMRRIGRQYTLDWPERSTQATTMYVCCMCYCAQYATSVLPTPMVGTIHLSQKTQLYLPTLPGIFCLPFCKDWGHNNRNSWTVRK